MREANILVAAVLSAATLTQGLQVTPGSSCQALCQEGSDTSSSSTNSSEIVCEDNDFATTGKGIKFKNCIECLQDSAEESGSDSDVFAYLYNLRYAFDVCLFSFPDSPDNGTMGTPCRLADTCGGLEDSLKTSITSPEDDDHYGFCEGEDAISNARLYKNCLQCLRATPDQKYFSNFLVALKAGCDQEPDAGQIVSLAGTLFSDEWTTILNPEDDVRNKPEGAGSNTLTTGAIVGIAVGCALLFIGAAVLLWVHFRRQRQNDRQKIESPSPETPGAPRFITSSRGPSESGSKHEMSESIDSYRARQDLSHKRAYSSNNAMDNINRKLDSSHNPGLGLSYHYTPKSRSNGPFGALPTHSAYDPRVMSRSSDRSQSPQPGSQADNSYALRTYGNVTDPSGGQLDVPRPLGSHHTRSYSHPIRQPSPPRPAVIPGNIPPPPARQPSKSKVRIPALILPSLSRAKAAKTYEPPQVSSRGSDNSNHGREISKPLAVSGARFEDRPLGGGTVLATEAPPGFGALDPNQKSTSPMLTGDSRLMYG